MNFVLLARGLEVSLRALRGRRTDTPFSVYTLFRVQDDCFSALCWVFPLKITSHCLGLTITIPVLEILAVEKVRLSVWPQKPSSTALPKIFVRQPVVGSWP